MDNFSHVAGITLPLLLKGMSVTLEVSVLAILFSLLVGFWISQLCLSSHSGLRAIARVYIKVFRCTPFMVQVYLAYYGLPALGLKISAFWIGVIIMSAYNAAYIAVIIESGIRSLPKGQTESAVAIGMSRFQTMTRILMPQTISMIMPPLTGQFLQTVKDSSVLSIITVAEMTMETNEAIGITFAPLIVYVLAGLLYWAINIVIEVVTRRIENRHRLARL
ncbi:MAG: amino acid ABC transporter permease [Eubacterium sp.]|nr:amino acid ABC transporter permease [Eubacterium sp.]